MQKEIDSIVAKLSTMDPSSEEYKIAVVNLTVLTKAQTVMKSGKVSSDTKWIVLGNLIGVVIIVGYEHGHVLTSKAMNYLVKGRV